MSICSPSICTKGPRGPEAVGTSANVFVQDRRFSIPSELPAAHSTKNYESNLDDVRDITSASDHFPKSRVRKLLHMHVGSVFFSCYAPSGREGSMQYIGIEAVVWTLSEEGASCALLEYPSPQVSAVPFIKKESRLNKVQMIYSVRRVCGYVHPRICRARRGCLGGWSRSVSESRKWLQVRWKFDI